MYVRAFQGHSGGNRVDLALQDTAHIPYAWIHHVGASLYCKAIIPSGLIGESKIGKEGRNTVFFTAVVLLKEPQRDEPYDVKGPRVVIGKCTTMQFIGST